MPLSLHKAFNAFEIIFGALSARMCAGAPRIAVSSSSTTSMREGRPWAVRSRTKSMAHTSFFIAAR